MVEEKEENAEGEGTKEEVTLANKLNKPVVYTIAELEKYCKENFK